MPILSTKGGASASGFGGIGAGAGGGGGGAFTFYLYGGGGGGGATQGGGGAGGYSKVLIEGMPTSFYIVVGEKGYIGSLSAAQTQNKPGNGGSRAATHNQGSSGGGFTGIFSGTNIGSQPSNSDAIAIVGGGGGCDWQDQGGNGGGVNADGSQGYDQVNGTSENSASGRPTGATLSSGGGYSYSASQDGCNGEYGSFMQGGDVTCTVTYAGGAGGGGYYGGGAGTGNTGNGGTPGSGGSGFLDTTNYTTTVLQTSGTASRAANYNPDNGTTYANPSAQYPFGDYGFGGNNSNNLAKMNGAIIIRDAADTTTLATYTSPVNLQLVTLSP